MWNVFVRSSKYRRPCHGQLAAVCASQIVAYLAFYRTFCTVEDRLVILSLTMTLKRRLQKNGANERSFDLFRKIANTKTK